MSPAQVILAGFTVHRHPWKSKGHAPVQVTRQGQLI